MRVFGNLMVTALSRGSIALGQCRKAWVEKSKERGNPPFRSGEGDIFQAAVALRKVIDCVRAQDSLDGKSGLSAGVRNGCENIVFLLMADLLREHV